MAQDCEKLFEQAEIDMGIIFHGKGTLCAQVFENSMRGKEKHYSELLNVAA